MPEQKDKSLDDQLKQAEIAKHKAETVKLNDEAKLALKQVTAKWYSGRSLAQITALVLTVVAVYTAIDKIFLAELKQKEARLAKVEAGLFQAQVDSLNREKARIITTIDSLKIRAIISARFGDLDSLMYANVLKQYKMIKANNYFDRSLNPDGGGIENEFDVRDVDGDIVIYDAETKLTWQWGSEVPGMTWKGATAYVDTITYAGFDDWRLPTLEEAMSLMGPKENKHGVYIDKVFGTYRLWIWTSDKLTASRAWYVFFDSGDCGFVGIVDVGGYVRAVR